MTAPVRAHARDAGARDRRVRVGEVTITPLVQFHYRVDPRRFFGDLDPRIIDETAWYWQPPYVDDGFLVIDMGGFLVRTLDRTVLVDVGVGNGKSRPNPCFDHRDDDWLAALHRAGATAEEVDTVVFTHLHVDHVGYATRFDGDAWVPTFPAARYLTTAAELDYWTGGSASGFREQLGDYVADSVLPLRTAGVLDLVEPDLRICDELRLVPAPGHTPGNVCVEVSSGGQRAIFAGDMVHHALQLAFPAMSTDFCVHADRAGEARRRLLHEIADRDVLLFPAHFPDSAPGRVVTDPAGGYRYEVVEGEPV
ncbi:MBL fold metallo-hydrolase [Pseudonocardia abyssalis]|uniref:MBL fold metallo-hydrolase n=1 Tax=Pseudonocardia abyssalis TaxID=2792008 RepID=A0ABS6UND3_9PSEU|nr:MBL fold metallo-hydrolase [Pseudonocardia abyssalis]MBW0115098.1 MBL fold metallo-hydrolase [Pseudonocardia abyssalis]MBW0133762.1 MBL fold metallo-hydrolase [Pseudonocardia abyssalis]